MSVTGIFRERVERHSLIRWFQRVFVIIPNIVGFCIVNEQMHISSATPEQIKASFKGVCGFSIIIFLSALPTLFYVPFFRSAESVIALSVVPPVVPSTVVRNTEPPTSSVVVDAVVKQQMIASFSEQSGMNTTWSLKYVKTIYK